ncbi:diol dehydratase small subunit [Pukyongiella litopenaei]|uniref:Glycerol dehydratase n=1 Tax=Pukyongiella litopenaei TaxID=2605946 RepID=A0A2S0MRQ3_9RHOB|nr:diol dehydratase small subunit [Pukyongiella litopenaei]AVO38526.1 glycerol dehydratase [Pukyongiella litopenaei]
MSDHRPTARDYPLAETAPDRVTGSRGRTLDELTLQRALSGEIGMEDLRITAGALRAQADVARSVARDALAENFERAAEMTRLPQDEIMAIYELLRPGRARSRDDLAAAAARLRTEFDAPRLAAFVDEAAGLYQKRGLFRTRY